MADEKSQSEADELKSEIENIKNNIAAHNLETPLDPSDVLYYLWMTWADFHLSVTWPMIEPIHPPIVHEPKLHEDGSPELVYPIMDVGYRLSTSRAAEGLDHGYCLQKYYNTIDKMILLLLQRLKTGGHTPEEEVRVAFAGFELGQRKAFESILNLENENIIVVNYDPGEWGERYMKNILTLVEHGYGLPKSSPRTDF